jgi:hypothetical protein
MTVHRQPDRVGAHDRADNGANYEPKLHHNADREEQRQQLHRCSVAPATDAAPRISRQAQVVQMDYLADTVAYR